MNVMANVHDTTEKYLWKISQVFQHLETINSIKENITGTGFSLSCLRHFTVFKCVRLGLGTEIGLWISRVVACSFLLSALIFDIQMVNRKV